MFDVLFKNATIITMVDENKVINNGCIAVAGGKIEYIGEKLPEGANALKTVDCEGDILMPGLINCHTHTAMTVLRGLSDDCTLNDWLFNHIFPAEAKIDLKSAEAGFTLGVCEMLSSGTTSFNDMYFYMDKTAHIADKAGIRMFACNAVIAISDDYVFENDRAVKETYNILADKSLSSRIRPQAGIHCERTSPPWVWEKEVALAKQYGLSMHIHLSETAQDHNDCISQYGKTPFERLDEHGVFDVPCIAAHCVHVSDSDMEKMAKKGVTAVHNPVSNLKLASGIADICRLRDAGVNVAIGTDGCSSNNSLNLFEDIKFAALLAKNKHGDASAFSAYDALKLATVNGAKAQGLDGVVGKLKAGYDADIIRISTKGLHRKPIYDPISSVVYCLGSDDVRLTMIKGKIVYENGVFANIDCKQAIKVIEEYTLPMLKE